MAAAKMSDRQHRRRLLEIAKSLISSDLDDLKFLCKDLIPAGEGEKITRPLEFFDRLEQLNLLSENNLGFLAEKLTDIKRIDLSCKLIGFTQDFALNKQQEEFNDVDALSQHETDFALNKQQEEFNDVDALSQHETVIYRNKVKPGRPCTFGKRSLTATKFKECLSSKFNELIINTQFNTQFNSEKFITLFIKNCEIKVKKNVLRRKIITNNHLNKRNTGEIIALRHYLFKKLLIPKFRNIFYDITLKEHNNGFLFWKDNNEKLTSEEYCNVIDQITLKYIGYYCQLIENTVSPDHDNDQKWAELHAEYECCMSILIGHVEVYWSKENNLMDINGHNNNDWKRFVSIDMSYGGLAVVLAMILSKA
ncbi:uncharacterized protein LOC144630097 isoform X2 [Oculina patagonica]